MSGKKLILPLLIRNDAELIKTYRPVFPLSQYIAEYLRNYYTTKYCLYLLQTIFHFKIGLCLRHGNPASINFYP